MTPPRRRPDAGGAPRRRAKRTVSGRPKTVYQVLVTLREVRPPVWRRILVHGNITLGRLHRVLQAAMGWEESHLHMFKVQGRRFSDPKFQLDDDGDVKVHDETRITLEAASRKGKQGIVYEYDFGDRWHHDLKVERVLDPADAPATVPAVAAGARACPPEDVGGAPGYESFLWALAHPNHKEHEHYREWIGGPFDPEQFDVGEAARRVRAFMR